MGHVLHFDCFSGVSGDMTLAALLDLGALEAVVRQALDSLELPGKLVVSRIKKAGFAACQVKVETPHEHAHRHLSHIVKIIDKGDMTDGARRLAKRIFENLGKAEAEAHGTTIEKVHFHEVGAVDSIFDIVGVAVAIDSLDIERFTCRPVPIGGGFVRCEHGNLPVPAPAVANLLRGIPVASSSIQSELTTPTGAAILATIVDEYVEQPALTFERIGLGAGTRDFPEQPNLLRLFLGAANSTTAGTDIDRDQVWIVETNVDDVPAEVIGYCFDRLFDEGALDVFTTQIHMKKNRPGTLISVLCAEDRLIGLERVLFEETGTLGVRRRKAERSKLRRKSIEVPTSLGIVRGKLGWSGANQVFTPEYDDCVRVARENRIPLRTVYRETIKGFEQSTGAAVRGDT